MICPNAPVLNTATTTSGSTKNAWDGFQATCQLGIARAELYRFDPPSRGRLRLTLNSQTQQTVSVRTDCADAGTEVACDVTSSSISTDVIDQVTTTDSLTVMVSAFNVLEEGPYTIAAEFLPESCGDGTVEGLEVCDDGNTNSNDGCSSDCSAVEYGFYCGQAATLSSLATGNNTNAPMVYTASCANNVFGSGPDRLFTYTAPSTGTLRLELQQANADLVLAVFDSCGAPSAMTELGCSSVYGVEKVELQVTSGQVLTVLVEGFNKTDVGPFSLSATMVP